MVEVIQLQAGESAPVREKVVVVGPSSDSRSAFMPGLILTRMQYDPLTPGAREMMIAAAQEYAERHKIPRVYVEAEQVSDTNQDRREMKGPSN
jgi:hypothetical protein